jgi:hypothetical protein
MRCKCAFQLRRQSVVIYFYCDTQDGSRRTLESLLTSLLVQLARASPALPPAISRLYERRHEGKPTTSLLQGALKETILLFSHVFLVVDALDEFVESDKESVLVLLSDLMTWNVDGLHVLVTSRPEHSILDAFESTAAGWNRLDLLSHVISADIALYLRETFKSKPFSGWPADLRLNAMDVLDSNADGM